MSSWRPALAPVLARGNLVMLESTSPVGTTRKMAALLAELRPDLKFPHVKGEMADCAGRLLPERVLPGRVLKELVDNDRSIGGITRKCAKRALDLYAIFVRGEFRVTNARTAELVKLTENAFRDVNIAFANELASICDRLRLNVWELIDLANMHPRVNILQPGSGRRRPLHRGRSLVHHRCRAGADPADPAGAQDQRQQAGLRLRQGAGACGGAEAAGDRLPGAVLQARHR